MFSPHIYLLLLRPWVIRWGRHDRTIDSRQENLASRLPGDQLVDNMVDSPVGVDSAPSTGVPVNLVATVNLAIRINVKTASQYKICVELSSETTSAT